MSKNKNPFPTRKRPKVRRGDYIPYSRIEKTLEERLENTGLNYTQVDIKAMARNIQKETADEVESMVVKTLEKEIENYIV